MTQVIVKNAEQWWKTDDLYANDPKWEKCEQPNGPFVFMNMLEDMPLVVEEYNLIRKKIC